MKPSFIIALLLIAIGIISLAYEGITYRTRENTVDLGPLKITTEQTHTIPLPPILGALALAGGIVLVVVSSKKP